MKFSARTFLAHQEKRYGQKTSSSSERCRFWFDAREFYSIFKIKSLYLFEFIVVYNFINYAITTETTTTKATGGAKGQTN